MLNVRDGAGDVAEPCRAPEHSDKETVVPWPMEERACSERARDHKIDFRRLSANSPHSLSATPR